MSNSKEIIDPLDWEIIEKLREDGRSTNSAIARELNITEGTVRHRVKRLTEKGILKISGAVKPGYVEKELLVVLGVNISESSKLRTAFEKITKLPEVRTTFITSGRYDFMMVVAVRGNRGLINFLTTSIAGVKEIVSTESFIVLKTDNYWI